MSDIETNLYVDVIETLLKRHGLAGNSFLVVDDVERWCVENGINREQEYRPFRVAKCLYSSVEAKYLILIAKTITDDMIASTNPIVAMRLGEKYADKLISHDFFIKHTILHEIGHTKGLSEEESDSFAFNEINKVGET